MSAEHESCPEEDSIELQLLSGHTKVASHLKDIDQGGLCGDTNEKNSLDSEDIDEDTTTMSVQQLRESCDHITYIHT